MKKTPITPNGHRKLKEELERLLKVDRPENVKAIEEARSHGDISENAEYHAAKERQSFIEGRIQELQTKIATAQIIDPSTITQDKAAFGAKVKIVDVDTNVERTYMLVGPDESDAKSGRISVTSPVGKSLIGKIAGDVVTIKAPAKTIKYKVVEISFE